MKKGFPIGDSGNEHEPDKERFFSEHIIDNSRSMVSIINRNYVYEKVNKPFSRAHKGLIKSFIGKSLFDVWGAEVFHSKIKNKVDLCFTGKTVRYEASFNTPKSGNRYFEVVFRPIKTSGGKVSHLMAETFDVTDLRKSQKTASDLRKEARKREIDFQNRLLQAQRLETIGVLAGGIAHDFNNILATISGYAEMLRDDLLNDPFNQEKTDRILSSVSRARSLTNQILTFSRQVGLEKSEVNVNDILKETLIFLTTTTPPGIIVDTDLAELELHVFADPAQLFRVFLNLMTNGIQSMEQKGGTLTVASRLIDSKSVRSDIKKDPVANEYVLVTIKDTGIGMDNSILPRIFEPFYTLKEVGKGTGLGLSVVYGIVSEMDGEIFVSSKLKEGSVFEVYLPVSVKITPVSENNNIASQ